MVSASPTLSFPINSQVPPVARTGELFTFVFSSTTFTSASGSDLSYSLVDPPSWLSLDSGSRTLSGTPQDSDDTSNTVVGVKVTLVATDATGSASDDATLVVSRSPGPVVQIPISEQIQGFGDFSEPSSILYAPDVSFEFTFANDTFSDPDTSALNYYPVTADNSPLPAWVTFDAGTLTFAGTTPPFSSLIEPPQTFSLKLIASDVTGFSAASVDFSIIVGIHSLTTNQPDVILNATTGHELAYGGLVGSIQVDGKDADASTVNITAQDLPSWLSFDQSSWNISGTPPDDAHSTNFTMVVQDAYADVLNITFNVQLTGNGSFFQSAFPALNVKAGEEFSFDLKPYLVDPSIVAVTADIQPATSWMSWDAALLTLSGDVPESAPKSVVDVTFTVASESSNKLKRATTSQTQKLSIQVEAAPDSTSSTSTPTSSTAASATASSSSGDHAEGAPKWTIIAIVVSAVAVVAVIACLCYCCFNRRRKKRDSQSTLDSTRDSAALPAGFIETPGHAVGSPDPRNSISPNEKEKGKLRKPSKLRAELTPPTNRSARSLADVYDDEPSSALSTPGSRLKSWFSELGSFRVVHLRRARPRVPSSFFSDYGSSHHDLDLETNQALTPSRPPVLPAPNHAHSQGSLHTGLKVDSQDSPGGRVLASNRQLSPGKNVPGLPTLGVSSIRLVEKDPFTETPPRAGSRTVAPIDEREAFNSHPISPITPVFPFDGPNSTFATTPRSAVTPSSAAGPSSLIASSSLLPRSTIPAPRRAATTPSRHPGLHPRRSNASASSTDTMRARTRNKLSAKAKGALFALQSPKRRTLAALGKKPSFQFVPRKKRSHRGVLESVDCDSESVLGATPSRRSRSDSRAAGGISGYLSPRIWPQPASGPSQPTSVPMPRVDEPARPGSEADQKRRRNLGESTHGSGSGSESSRGSVSAMGFPAPPLRMLQPPIRRRPVPAPTGAAVRSSAGSGDSGQARSRSRSPDRSLSLSLSLSLSPVQMPSPLRTPGMSGTPTGGGSGSGGSSGAGAGLGISTYEDIVRSSPLHPSREVGTGAGRDEDVELSHDMDWGDSWTLADVSSLMGLERERRGSLAGTTGEGWTSALSDSGAGSTGQHSAKSSAVTATGTAGVSGGNGDGGERATTVGGETVLENPRHSLRTEPEGRRSGVSGRSGKSKASSGVGAFV